jgi:hypothetical protein
VCAVSIGGPGYRGKRASKRSRRKSGNFILLRRLKGGQKRRAGIPDLRSRIERVLLAPVEFVRRERAGCNEVRFRGEEMRKLLWIGAVACVALVTYSMAPDIRRYIRMVSM